MEFFCVRCGTRLQVPDGRAGRLCVCPSCSHQQPIPSLDGIQSSKNEVQRPVDASKVDVQCPRCHQTLICDRSLIGTRGHCAGCGQVFTIAEPGSRAAIDNQSPSIAFQCPQCKKLFEGIPESVGRKARCSDCATVFSIEPFIPVLNSTEAKPSDPVSSKWSHAASPSHRDSANKVVPQPSSTSSPKSAPRSAPSKSLEPSIRPQSTTPFSATTPTKQQDQSDLRFDQFLPSPTIPSVSDASFWNAPATPVKKKVRSESSTGAGTVVFWVCGVIGALGGLGVLALVGLLVVGVALANASKEISVGGFTASAPGKKAISHGMQPNQMGESIVHPITRSEFAISTLQSDSRWQPTPDGYLANLRLLNLIAEERPVSRAGLNGIHYTTTGQGSLPLMEGEVFSINSDTVLILMYINGSDHPLNQSGKDAMTREVRHEYDRPNEFFDSLRTR